jgi:2-dehydropantoate 2-reductase
MKILIVGAGIVGTIYGWAFAEAGHAVTHLVRPGRGGMYPDGINIDMYDLRKGHKKNFLGHYPIRLTETVHPSDGYDLLIVPTKHYSLVETLQQVLPQTGLLDTFLLTQNWTGTAEIDALLPPSRYVYGDAKAGGKFEGNSLIATLDSVAIGQVDGRHDACLDKVIALCRSAQVGLELPENILHYLWVQYAITGGLWPALVKTGSLSAALSDRQVGEQAFLAVRECLEVPARRGVDLQQYPQTKMYAKASPIAMQIAGLAIKVMFRFNKLVQRSSAHGLGDPREVQTFYYDLLHTGRELGIPMPSMQSFEPDIQQFISKKGN